MTSRRLGQYLIDPREQKGIISEKVDFPYCPFSQLLSRVRNTCQLCRTRSFVWVVMCGDMVLDGCALLPVIELDTREELESGIVRRLERDAEQTFDHVSSRVSSFPSRSARRVQEGDARSKDAVISFKMCQSTFLMITCTLGCNPKRFRMPHPTRGVPSAD